MSTVDLDDIRERVESRYVGVPPWSAGQDARVLLGEVEQANARTHATRQMSIEANARLRAILLSALDLEDDGKTSLTAYVLATVADRDRLRADLDVMYRVRDGLAAEVERLRAGSDVVDAALAYVNAPDGTDEVAQCWFALEDAVGTYQRASTGEDTDGTS